MDNDNIHIGQITAARDSLIFFSDAPCSDLGQAYITRNWDFVQTPVNNMVHLMEHGKIRVGLDLTVVGAFIGFRATE